MSPATTFATAAAFAAALAGALATGAAPAVADDSQLFGVKAIDVRLSGATPALTVRNVAANHNLDSLQPAVQGSKASVAVSGYVDCRTEERRGGKAWVRTCSSRGSPNP